MQQLSICRSLNSRSLKFLPIAFVFFVGVLAATPTAFAGSAPELHPAKRDTAAAMLQRSIGEAITMLERKEYVPFLKRFVHPKDTAALLDDCGTLQQCAEAFATEKAEVLLKVLRKIHGRKPKMDRKKQRATFVIRGVKESTKGEISWEQAEGVWYIRN